MIAPPRPRQRTGVSGERPVCCHFRVAPGGFTLIELVIVIVLIGALAAVAYTRLDTTGYGAYAYAESAKVAVRSAHRLATARNQATRVTFSASGFAIQRHADGSFITNPATGQPWDGSQPNRGGAPAGVTMSVSGPGSVFFDGLGRVFRTDGTPLATPVVASVSGDGQTFTALTIEISGHVR